jgi:isochorismate synthase
MADEAVRSRYHDKNKRVTGDKVAEEDENDEVRQRHIELVKRGIGEIKKGALAKVVLSRKLEMVCYKDPNQIFLELLGYYPNAFCYLFYHPKVGLWLGATPETLLSIKDNYLTTISLAGTQKAVRNLQPDWGDKEMAEQALVTGYLRNLLKEYVDDMEISEVASVRAGDLWHLRTVITGTLKDDARLVNALKSLHPTPAVCGLPLEAAKAFLGTYEQYDREFYTGFLGELNLNNREETSLFVNLRCTQLKNGKAIIYAGGGVTVDSVPEMEWKETVAKTSTVMRALFNSGE